MKSILQINTLLMNSNVEERDFSNNISSSTNALLPPNIDSNIAVNFIKNIIFNNNIKGDSTSKRIIESVIFFSNEGKEDSLFNILNMRNNNNLIMTI